MSRPTFFHALAASLLAAGLLAAAAEPGCAAPAAPPLRVLPTGGLRAESAALLMSGQEGGTILFAALALPFPGEGERARVPLIVEMDGTDLLAGQRDPLLRLEISLYALAGTGNAVQASRMDTVEIDLEQLGAGVGESGVRYVGELPLPPGDYRLRILVRNMATGELGLRTLPLTVPPFSKSSGILLPPAFADPGPDLWVTARPAGASPLAALAPADPPSARPILAPDEKASVIVAGWRLGTGDLRLQVSRRLRADLGETGVPQKAADLPVEVIERRPGPDGLETFVLTFRPEGLELGEYDLRATMPRSAADSPGDAYAGDAVSMGTSFVLFPGGARGSVWAALNSGGRAPEMPVARKAGAPAEAPRKLEAGPVRKAYRDALALLAAGDSAAATAAVRALESSLLAGKRRHADEDVTEIEVGVVRDLAQTHPEILEPVFMLHQGIYRDASADHDYVLMNHARSTALLIADLHAGLHATPEGRKRTARLILGLAADLLKTAPQGMRERTYRRVLELDPDNQDTLICLAADLERQDRYQDAAEILARLLKSHPEHGEGRLRLAVDRIRLCNLHEGRRLLEDLVRTPPDQIVRVGAPTVALAYQELVRLLIDLDELPEAARRAREGLERIPGEEKLMLQLALLQDLRHDARGAQEILEPLERRPRPPEPVSARHRYNALPLERLEAIRDELAGEAASHLADLAAALGGGEAP